MRHHLAVVYRTYLDEIIAGRKTVECRFGRADRPPHGVVQPGDLIWLKEVSGPIRAVVRTEGVRCLSGLTPAGIDQIRQTWNRHIRGTAAFWRSCRHQPAVTLVWFGDLCPLRAFWIDKSDRRAWVVLAGPPLPGRPVEARNAGAVFGRRLSSHS